MAKKSKKQTKKNSFLFILLALLGGIMTFVSMAFNFFGHKTFLGDKVLTENNMTMSGWFDFISTFSEADKIGTWIGAKILFIALLVLVGLILVCMLCKLFVKKPVLNIIVKVLACLTIVVSIIFIVLSFIGANALSSKILGTYYPQIAVYLLTIFSVLTSIFAGLASKK